MNIRQLRDLAIKFIGLNCLLTALFMLLQAFSMLGFVTQGGLLRGLISALGYAVTMAAYGLVVYLLLAKTHVVTAWLWPNEEVDGTDAGDNVALSIEACVALIGVYNIPRALSSLVYDIVAYAAAPENLSISNIRDNVLHSAFLLSIAVLCIVKSKAIAAYIRKYAE